MVRSRNNRFHSSFVLFGTGYISTAIRASGAESSAFSLADVATLFTHHAVRCGTFETCYFAVILSDDIKHSQCMNHLFSLFVFRRFLPFLQDFLSFQKLILTQFIGPKKEPLEPIIASTTELRTEYFRISNGVWITRFPMLNGVNSCLAIRRFQCIR